MAVTPIAQRQEWNGQEKHQGQTESTGRLQGSRITMNLEAVKLMPLDVEKEELQVDSRGTLQTPTRTKKLRSLKDSNITSTILSHQVGIRTEIVSRQQKYPKETILLPKDFMLIQAILPSWNSRTFNNLRTVIQTLDSTLSHSLFLDTDPMKLQLHLINMPANLLFEKKSLNDPDTLTWGEAMSELAKNVSKWLAAADKKIKALEEKETWNEVPQSEATIKVIPGIWVFRRKRAPNGTITKWKSRTHISRPSTSATMNHQGT
jgi:hypothetical protein